MKYTDIEFANQPVVIPLYADERAKRDIIDDLLDLINTADVIREQRTSFVFEGSFLPPTNILQLASEKNATRRPSKTKVLKKMTITKKRPETNYNIDPKNVKTTSPNIESQELFMQDKKDYGFLHFTKQEAQFLRLVECVRKFAMEHEAGDTKDCLWPWYKNSFHSDDKLCRDVQNYEELIYKHNFMNIWSITELLLLVQNHVKENTEKPIRFKRKFAAEFLLSPHDTARNINLIRNQLKPLLDDIIHDSMPRNDKTTINIEMGEEVNHLDVSDELRSLSGIHLGKIQQNVQNYCKNKINEDLNALQKYDEDNVMALIEDICIEMNDDVLTDNKSLFAKYINGMINCNSLSEMTSEKFATEIVDNNNESKEDMSETAIHLWNCLIKRASNTMFWPTQIETTNNKFKEKVEKHDKYGLFDECIERLSTLNIDRVRLPIFEEFVEFFFVNTDKAQHNIIHNSNSKYLIGRDHMWYRTFLESWRATPIWYSYDHDILLLELVLRNGLDSSKILNDLQGNKMIQYKIRLRCNETNTMDDPYYEFKGWCSNMSNILHRLKYVTTIIVQNLENTKYGGNTSLISIRIVEEELIDDYGPTYNISSLLFTDYQRETHCTYVGTKADMLFAEDMKKDNVSNKEKDEEEKCCCCHGIFKLVSKVSSCSCCTCNNCCNKTKMIGDRKYEELEIVPAISVDDGDTTREGCDCQSSQWLKTVATEYEGIQSTNLPYMLTRRRCRVQDSGTCIRQNDPFIQRDINIELLQSFQAFDLFTFGKPLVKCIIQQIQKESRDAYWYILGEILNALPYPLAISEMQDDKTRDSLRHAATPYKLDQICYRLIEGSSFRPSAALGIAEFFDELASMDFVQEDAWKKLSRKYEVMAYKEVSQIESDHLLFVLLNIPLLQHHGDSLFDLALQQKRIGFLNNDRINSIIQHLYQTPFLKPDEFINMSNATYYDLLKSLFFYPFRFYFTAQGYHWIGGMLYMLYLGFVCIYVYNRSIDGIQFYDDEESAALEIMLWCMNIGYVLFEIMECSDKGITKYLNLSVSGQTNILDVMISSIWIVLFCLRIHCIINKCEFDPKNVDTTQKIYMVLFGVQFILLTLRALALLSNTQYLGTLWRVIKLMLFEITKFLSIFFLMMTGFVFGLWLISAANKCEYNESDACDDYEGEDITHVIIYIFQVFIGTGDLSGVAGQGIAVVFMVIATLFGALILTNLLIALMTTEYENVQEEAKGELTYNQAELTHDLSERSRLMPPPLNILVLVVAFIVDIINFFFALIKPSQWNIYVHIDHQSFFNLQNWNIWQCEHDKWKQVRGSNIKYKTQSDVLKWYFTGCWHDWIKNANCCGCKDDKNKNNEKELNLHWRIHHRACYGVLVLHTDHETVETYTGITMPRYCEEYERERKQRIETKDKQLLKRLTTDTLFCEYCYKPFLKDNVADELTTSYLALLDLISAIMFIIIPVAWIPLLLLFGILSLIDKLLSIFQDEDQKKSRDYKHTDFDKEYFPNQFKVFK